MRIRGGVVLALSVTAALVAAGCSSSAPKPTTTLPGATTTSTAAPVTTAGGSTTTTVPLAHVSVSLKQVGSFDEPIALVGRTGSPVVYVEEKVGKILELASKRAVLDISSDVVDSGEQGLLGPVFSPDGKYLYLDYTAKSDGAERVEVFTMNADGTANVASRRRLLTISDPQPNHNGGQLAFGPDGFLYYGIGDGGAANDEGTGHAPGGNAQSTQVLLGKILRLNPTPTGAQPYTIPPGNPFASGGGRAEIWAYGLRNPWRFSFDRATGDLWIGDVGQDQWEEIDYMPPGQGAGANFGWNRYEGNHRYRGTDVAGTVKPVFEYSHDFGCAIVGGFVYRGPAAPTLNGTYLYSDNCQSTLRLLRRSATGAITTRAITFRNLANVGSFGEDLAGNVYVLSQNGPVFELTK
jgi:glucose/arabinose dehydrogenase